MVGEIAFIAKDYAPRSRQRHSPCGLSTNGPQVHQGDGSKWTPFQPSERVNTPF